MLPRLTIAAAIVAAALSAAPVEARHKDEGLVVQDLAYGEVLFDFFKEDYFDALTRLLAAEQRNEIPHHLPEAEVLDDLDQLLGHLVRRPGDDVPLIDQLVPRQPLLADVAPLDRRA